MSTAAANIIETTPFSLSPQQSQALQSASADLSAEQLIWSSGYLAGLAVGKLDQNPGDQSRLGAAVAAPLSVTTDSEQFTVLYGSQTGNGRALAQALYQQAIASGLSAELLDMADFSVRDMAKLRWAAIVVSTHGEGDAPDDAELLLEYLQGDRAPQLSKLNYTVLALGDSSYAQFCQTGRDFDEQLETLGARRFGDRVECDLDYQASATAWSEKTIEVVKDALEEISGVDANLGKPPVTLQVVGSSGIYTRDNPFEAEVLLNQKITGDRSSKTVQHLEIDLQGSGLHYEPGDALSVVTKNPVILVDEFLAVLGVDGAVRVSLEGESIALSDALENRLEITANSGAFLQRYVQLVDHSQLATWLDDGERKRELLNDYQIIDVLHEWPLASALDDAQVQAFVDTLRVLTPRVYSISSSLLATPDEVHLTVAEVAYQKFGRPHWGSASTALTHAIKAGDQLNIFVEENPRFRLPQDVSTDVIMIGPGTGVAPFRAFLEHRIATKATGRNWLFFGDRNFDEDFLYQTEWKKELKLGNLHRMDVAFSRDQAQKIYVQDRLIENGQEIFNWLQNGARLYVCGDSANMAPDVHQALVDIVARYGNQSSEDAVKYLTTLKREQRYLRDVY